MMDTIDVGRQRPSRTEPDVDHVPHEVCVRVGCPSPVAPTSAAFCQVCLDDLRAG